jgi:hypothetical protein
MEWADDDVAIEPPAVAEVRSAMRTRGVEGVQLTVPPDQDEWHVADRRRRHIAVEVA